jgi:glucokinase
MNYIGIDVGGSHICCALVNGRVIAAKQPIDVSDNSSLKALLPALEDSICSLLKHEESQSCQGIAFSFCGIVDTLAGRIIQTNGRYSDAPDIDFPEWACNRFRLPLRIENVARTALLGEWVAGAARGFGDVVMIILGTGVGGAAMIGGKLLRGKHSQAGCLLGHFGAKIQGRLCSCGNLGCVEAEASTAVLETICHEHSSFAESSLRGLERLTFKDVFLHADAGDTCARDIRERCIQVWAAGTVSWIHAYDPELIVFGGGIMSAPDAILPSIQTYVDRHAWTPWGKVVLRKAVLGNEASLLAGPALLAEAR